MLINVDWLQINCLGRLNSDVLPFLKLLPYHTQVFEQVFEYSEGEQLIATIACKPFSTIIDPYTHLVKFHNKVLYSPNFVAYAKELISRFGLSIKSFSRLDICVDFNLFMFGLKPESLISKFVNNEYLAIGRRPFKIHGTSGKNATFEYLRFGKPDSEVSVYLYNKSLELEKVHQKPWIIASWQQYGKLNVHNVWRLEFSIKGNRLQQINKLTGEVSGIQLDNLQDDTYMFNLVSALILQYFRFRHNRGESNVSRMKPVELLNNLQSDFFLKSFVESHESGRAEKIFIKKIEKFNNEIRALKKFAEPEKNPSYFIGDEYLKRVVSYFDMEKFYNSKVKSV